jgi:hypothetical protein
MSLAVLEVSPRHVPRRRLATVWAVLMSSLLVLAVACPVAPAAADECDSAKSLNCTPKKAKHHKSRKKPRPEVTHEAPADHSGTAHQP